MTTWTREELDKVGQQRNWRSRRSGATAHKKAGDDLGGPCRRRALRTVRERALLLRSFAASWHGMKAVSVPAESSKK